MMPRDTDAVKGAKVSKSEIRRVWRFARPYRLAITGFLVSILLSAFVALVPPFAFRRILDSAIPDRSHSQINVLAGIVVGAALADAALAILQRWWSARIGEGLIYDLRVALFDKVQRMPLGFFTRAQTGSVVSRLNNDVVGAQTAVTSTLGSVVSNVVVLVTTLAAMLTLEWRLTLLSLVVLPSFIIPARRVGRRLQTISRQQMNLNGELNTQMVERFNVAGALLVKLFGRRRDEVKTFADRAGEVRDIGVRSAMYGRVSSAPSALQPFMASEHIWLWTVPSRQGRSSPSQHS
jgi:ATP-binding cassette subfamily B protein